VNNILLKERGAFLAWEHYGLRLEGDRYVDNALVSSTRQRGQIAVIIRPTFLARWRFFRKTAHFRASRRLSPMDRAMSASARA
jgi:hypothetical protein